METARPVGYSQIEYRAWFAVDLGGWDGSPWEWSLVLPQELQELLCASCASHAPFRVVERVESVMSVKSTVLRSQGLSGA